VNLYAVFPVESVFYVLPLRVDLIQDHVCVGLVAGRESYDLVVLGHPFQKADGVGPDGDVGLGNGSILNLNRQSNIVGFGRIFFAMQDGLVDIDKKCFFANISLVPGKVDLPLLQISKSRRFYLVVVPEHLQRYIEMVECPLVPALQSSPHMHEIVALDFVHLRYLLRIILRYSYFAEAADGGGLFCFAGGFRVDALSFLNLLV